jgi:hypothetical protein
MTYIDEIAKLGACSDAIDWLCAEQHPTFEAAWTACPDGIWLLWYAGRMAGPPGHASRIPLVLAACDCAATVLHLVPAGEERPRRAIEAARAWVRGEATMGEARRAADAADAAAGAYVHHAAAAAYAAHAAAYAAAAAYDDTASGAAAATYDAATYDDADLAHLVRRHYPTPPTPWETP